MDCEATTAARFHRQEETPHQGWMKPFLELTPGPNPAEQQSRAWGCPPARVAPAQAVGRARDGDQSGIQQGSSLLTPCAGCRDHRCSVQERHGACRHKQKGW